MLLIFISFFSMAAAISLFFLGWVGKLELKMALPLGLLAILASFYCSIAAVGAEYGTAIALIALAISAWLVTVLRSEVLRSEVLRRERRRNARPQPRAQVVPTTAWRSVGMSILRFLVAVPLSGLSALLSTVWLASTFGWSPADGAAFTVIFFPLIWAILSYLICSLVKLWPASLGLAFTAILSWWGLFGAALQ